MTTRLLPPEEWHRLPAVIGDLLPHMVPEDVQVVVIEDATGAIVGTWTAARMVHLEGLWIAPEHRGRPSVARRLYQAGRAAAAQWTAGWAMTGAASDDVRSLLDRVGAVRLPLDTYVLPLRKQVA